MGTEENIQYKINQAKSILMKKKLEDSHYLTESYSNQDVKVLPEG